jgi:hypothetical protein
MKYDIVLRVTVEVKDLQHAQEAIDEINGYLPCALWAGSVEQITSHIESQPLLEAANV